MRLLLDTDVLLWWQLDSPRLSERARSIISDGSNTLLWSAASSWELAIKIGLGRLTLPEPLGKYLPHVLREGRITPLAIEHPHTWEVTRLPPLHRDPFDRLLVAQARLERVPLLSVDERLEGYGVERVW
jgi:PIN domain nuclease of toxin-antitoxin system